MLGLERLSWSSCGWRHIAAFIFGVFVVGPISFWAFDRFPPIEIHSASISPDVINAGDRAVITWAATMKRPCDGTIHRRFIDSSGTIFDMAPVSAVYRHSIEEGMRRTFSREIILPIGMAPGGAVMSGIREYRCNPVHWLWPIRIEIAPLKFRVA